MPDNAAITATFLVYLGALLGLGLIAWRETRDLSDYILGGRRLGSTVTALSAGASDMSGWLLLGLPGYAYMAGLESAWLALGLLMGTALNWIYVAKPLRQRSAALNDSLTLPDYFENRFQDRSRLLRIVSAFFILLFFVFYTASGLVAGGKLFTAVFAMPYHWAVLAGAGAVVAYTFMGGFLAVSWTDALQAGLMIAALLLVAGFGVHGFDAARLPDPALLDPFSGADGSAIGGLTVLSLLAWGLGYFGQPHILARFMAIDRVEGLGKARNIALVWTFLGLISAIAVGLSGWQVLKPGELGADPEQVFIVLVGVLFHPLVAGICLAAILAAIMSTADSQLLVASSALTEDFYKQLFRPQAGAVETVWVGRGAVVAVAMVALSLAWSPDSGVLDLVSYAWAGFGAAFGPAIVFSLYWEKMTRAGAFAGILIGALTVIVWKPLSGGVFDVYELLPGFMFASLAIWLVSKATSKG
ncbi:MAG: sodium/proline symporter PutP [Gammaproteobacteria bacterium]|nr:sodium/proline symporter PutP [Gammaproteobacteria bacterium]MCP5138112.1 sodium/proline symporter PutP [Gammaproteobacteria bacterium]